MKLWSIILTWIYFTPKGATQTSINKVVCADSTATQLIQCGENHVIDIQNVTIGILTNCMNIPEMQRFGQFYALNPPCVRSLKQDGELVYRRCHGEESCTLDGSVVPIVHLMSQTDVCGWTTSTALWFRYSCQNGLFWQPYETVVTTGMELHIFSPCFPSSTPISTARTYEVDCTMTPERTVQYSRIYYQITPKLLKMYPGSNHCRDYLFFNRGSSSDPQHNLKFGWHYCGRNDGVQVEVWNDDVITPNTIHDVHITYRALLGAAGTKYWFLVTATEEGSPVKITATCNVTRDISQELVCPAPQATRPPPPTVTTRTTKTTTTTSTTTRPPPTTTTATTKIASLTTQSTSANGSTRSDALLPEIGEEPIKDGQDAGAGSTGLVIGLVIAVVIIVVLAVFGAVVTWKLRKMRGSENKTSTNPNDTNKYAPDPTTNYHDAYEIIPDHLVNGESGNGLPNPVISTTPVTTVGDPSAYEEVQKDSEESKAAEETTGQSTGEYEDISPKDKPYESLKRAVYENAAETPKLKIYAGLDQTKRQSTA